MATVSERLKTIMELKNIKQADLVKLTGINKGALSSYISGRYVPKQTNTYLLAKALNVNEAWLMGSDVPMERIEDSVREDSNNEYTLPPQIQRTAYKIYKSAPVIYKVYDSDDREDLVKHADYLNRRQGLLLNAAHERTDIEVTSEMLANDEDIMDDENF